MEHIVVALTNLWFLSRREHYITKYLHIASVLKNAIAHLEDDFKSRASFKDRGELLPQQHDALLELQNSLHDLNKHIDDLANATFWSSIGLNAEILYKIPKLPSVS